MIPAISTAVQILANAPLPTAVTVTTIDTLCRMVAASGIFAFAAAITFLTCAIIGLTLSLEVSDALPVVTISSIFHVLKVTGFFPIVGIPAIAATPMTDAFLAIGKVLWLAHVVAGSAAHHLPTVVALTEGTRLCPCLTVLAVKTFPAVSLVSAATNLMWFVAARLAADFSTFTSIVEVATGAALTVPAVAAIPLVLASNRTGLAALHPAGSALRAVTWLLVVAGGIAAAWLPTAAAVILGLLVPLACARREIGGWCTCGVLLPGSVVAPVPALGMPLAAVFSSPVRLQVSAAATMAPVATPAPALGALRVCLLLLTAVTRAYIRVPLCCPGRNTAALIHCCNGSSNGLFSIFRACFAAVTMTASSAITAATLVAVVTHILSATCHTKGHRLAIGVQLLWCHLAGATTTADAL